MLDGTAEKLLATYPLQSDAEHADAFLLRDQRLVDVACRRVEAVTGPSGIFAGFAEDEVLQ